MTILNNPLTGAAAGVRVVLQPNEIILNQLAQKTEQQIRAIQRQCLQDMANTMYEIVIGTLGKGGRNRPMPWAPLSRNYARRVGRPYATLVLTGRLLSSITKEIRQESSKVFIRKSDVPYALAHQYGNPGHNLPARPYFPILNGRLTSYAERQVSVTAQRTLWKLLRKT